MHNVVTRQMDADRFAALGITGAALDALVQEQAPARHASRVQAAWDAARRAAFDLLDGKDVEEVGQDMKSELDLLAQLLAILDAAGWGGPGGVGGDASGRLGCFSRLGKGRKQATDGPAWSAAIADVAHAPASPDGQGPWVYADLGADSPGLTITNGQDTAFLPVSWMPPDVRAAAYTMAREGLRRAAGLGAWHDELILGGISPEHALVWGELVNALAAARAEQVAQPPVGGRRY